MNGVRPTELLPTTALYLMSAITHLLEPRSIVVVGASDDPTRIGGRPLHYLRASGFAGLIQAVNPNRDSVQGYPSFPSVSALPAPVDLAIIALPAEMVTATLDECGEKGIRTAIVFSAGFAETGETGRAMQEAVLTICSRYGLRVLGPNCLGAFNTHIGFYGTFTQAFSTGFIEPGPLAIASQSGACGGHLAYLCRQRNIGIGYWITTGNEADIDLSDCLLWLARSPKVKVIMAYAESIRDGAKFVEALRMARELGKPVILLKVGRSASGARAAASHTGALAGEDAVYDAVLRQFGAHRANSIEEMLDVAYACLAEQKFTNNKLGLVTVSGGVGVQMADAADEFGLEIPQLSDAAQAQIKALIPFASAANPIDLTAQLTNDRTLLGRCIDLALAESGFGAILCFLTSAPASPVVADSMFESFKTLRGKNPDLLIVLSFVAPMDVVRRFEGAGLLVFEDANRAIKALAALSRFEASFRAACDRSGRALPDAIELPALGANRPEVFDEHSAKQVLAEVGIPSLPEVLARNPEQVQAAVAQFDRPVALKIVSPDLLHKTEIQGVVLNVTSPDAAREVAGEMLERVRVQFPAARLSGILVAPMCEKGLETICGVYQDPVFGPVVLFGLGGIYVEVLKDVALRLAPFDQDEALAMIGEIRGAALLRGVRGKPAADIEALARVLSRLSAFAHANRSWVAEIDINPFMVLEAGRGGFALDALIQTR